MGLATLPERLFLETTAEEYRNKGYAVDLEVELDFFPNFRVDLVARKDGETKVIEVKTKSSLAATPRIVDLVRALHAKPGWSFELLSVAEPPTLKAPVDSKSLEFESLPKRLEQAEGELASCKPELAYMLAWGTAEAAIRGLLAVEGHSITDIPTTSSLLAQALTLDVISDDEHEVLTRLNTYRNAIAHGYGVPDFTDTLVTDLLKVVRRLVDAATLPGDVAQSEGQ